MKRVPDEFVPMFLEAGGTLAFPDPTLADDEGLVAVGGDLSVDRLVHGYSHAIFPWFDDESPPLWWSPNPRCILPLDDLHVSRRLMRRIRQADFDVSWNQAFERVMLCCSADRTDGTWITDEMLAAYVDLHDAGHAHSLEVWSGDQLVGGLYGVQVGGLFAAESKFHRETDMSKIALVATANTLARAGITLFDVQLRTEHLSQFGCADVPRSIYLQMVRYAVMRSVDLSNPIICI